jgi:hypothetical protein
MGDESACDVDSGVQGSSGSRLCGGDHCVSVLPILILLSGSNVPPGPEKTTLEVSEVMSADIPAWAGAAGHVLLGAG